MLPSCSSVIASRLGVPVSSTPSPSYFSLYSIRMQTPCSSLLHFIRSIIEVKLPKLSSPSPMSSIYRNISSSSLFYVSHSNRGMPRIINFPKITIRVCRIFCLTNAILILIETIISAKHMSMMKM